MKEIESIESKTEKTPVKYWTKKEGDSQIPYLSLAEENFNSPQERAGYFVKKMEEIVGVGDFALAVDISESAARVLEAAGEPFGDSRNIILQTLYDLKPRDSNEGRLCAQAAVLYSHAMRNLKRAGEAEMLCHIESLTNLSIKLMRAHNEAIDALGRYRRGGEQKVTVQHNVVADKAIVNNVTGVGVLPKKRGGTPCSTRNAEQKQEPMTIDHVDNPPWQMEDVDSMGVRVPAHSQQMGRNDKKKRT